jgi:putative oxygen-independent coproporphyrinogen III oxidase
LPALQELGIYLHFPWCRKRCPYCDFAIEVGGQDDDGYLTAVLAELARRAEDFPGQLVAIYLGGGTPSLWRPDCIARAIAACCERYGVRSETLEVTLEANPTDCDAANLGAWRHAGVNRLSIGVQSLEPRDLVTLGRDHRFGDGLAAIERAVQHGGFTVTADFILGTPSGADPMPRWIEPVAETGVDHLSVYELTIEERTAFGQRVRDGRIVPHDEDTLTALYLTTDAALARAGFEHYEISSYARPGKRAVHNSLYWRGSPYLGLGSGAASLRVLPDGSAERATNPRRVADYLAGAAPETHAQTASELRADRAWLGLRTSAGVPELDLAPSPGAAEWLVTQGLAERRDGRICPTLRGFLMADRIAARIVQTWGDGSIASL